jgi:ubiquinone/menaquinone biosynthesis C-methylase UbiE
MIDTSWQNVSQWYDQTVGDKGHYYHEHIVIPGVLRLMKLKEFEKVLDLGCGQGILGRSLPNTTIYTGMDLSADLIKSAQENDKSPNHYYVKGDATDEFKTNERFDWVTLVLALQNIKSPYKAIRSAASVLKDGGKILIVLNHPAFRIPKHSDWFVDSDKKVQFRREGVYMSRQEIPIELSPFDKKNNKLTWSFHYPLSAYTEMLSDNGLLIETMEEWVSDKKSEGSMAKVEDTARAEFPLFLTIVARFMKK